MTDVVFKALSHLMQISTKSILFLFSEYLEISCVFSIANAPHSNISIITIIFTVVMGQVKGRISSLLSALLQVQLRALLLLPLHHPQLQIQLRALLLPAL